MGTDPSWGGGGDAPTSVVQEDHCHVSRPEVLGGQLQRSEHITHLLGLGWDAPAQPPVLDTVGPGGNHQTLQGVVGERVQLHTV